MTDFMYALFSLITFMLGLYLGNGQASRWHNEVIRLTRAARKEAVKTFNEGRYVGIAHGQTGLNAFQAGQTSVMGDGDFPDDDPPEEKPTTH